MAASSGDSRPIPIYGARFRLVLPVMDADGDLVTGASTPDSEISKDQGTFADCTNEVTEIATSSGMYYLDLTATEMTCECAAVIVKSATSGMKTTPIVLYPTRLPVLNAGTAQAGAAGTITLASAASSLDDIYNGCLVRATNDTPSGISGEARTIIDYDGTTKVATIAPNWNTTPSSSTTYDVLTRTVAQATLGSIQSAVGSVNSVVQAPSDSSGVTTLLSRLSAARATSLDAISLRNATAQGGAAGSITLDASASATDGLYSGLWVIVESGTGIGQARLVTGYTGSTKVATVAPSWATNPDNTSVFALVPAAKISGVTLADAVTVVNGLAAAVITATAIASDAITAAKVADGTIDAATFAAGAINAAAIAADAIGASELATDAVTEIVSAIFARAFSSAYGSYTFDELQKMFAAVLLAKASGMGTATGTFRNLADNADVVVATIDANGNRSAVTLTP